MKTIESLVKENFMECWNKNGYDTEKNVAHKIMDKVKKEYTQEEYEEIIFNSFYREVSKELIRLYGYPF